MMKTSRAFWIGVAGAAMITVLAGLCRAMGLPMNMEMMLGAMVTGVATTSTWWIGFFIHLVVGGLFGLLYGFLFERVTHRAGWQMGLAFGAVHTVVSGSMLALMPVIHPAIPSVLPAPGAFAINLGVWGVIAFAIVHLAYGALVGGVYAPVRHPVHRPAHAAA